MIADRNEMRQIESASGYSEEELMEKAGKAVADELKRILPYQSRLFILAGNGNNGGDAYVAARLLKDFFIIRIFTPLGKPKTASAAENYNLLDQTLFIPGDDLSNVLNDADAVLDGVFGFSYHGLLSERLQQTFDLINRSDKKVYSIDINSGAECDTGFFDEHALRSEVTFALDCYKPFHLLRKEHFLFKEVKLLSLGLPHPLETKWKSMDEDTFFSSFPHKKENAYKNTFGKTLLIGGSYGMAGALSFNITGAETIGAGYIQAAMTHDIYPIEAVRHTRTVFLPFGHDDYMKVLQPAVQQASAVSFGSGAVNMDRKNDILDLVLQYSRGPVVLDAEALNLLIHNTWVLRYANSPVILTPHIGEFSRLINKPVKEISRRKIDAASAFARRNHVILVLKGPNTIIAAPDGRCAINQSGNAALAQAGSGDLLTGMITAMLTMEKDVFKAVCMAVWLHGWIADQGLQYHSMQNFPLEEYPKIMDHLFQKHGY